MDPRPSTDLFPKDVRLAAQQSERQSGVPACLTLAQWAVESDYGAKLIGRANCFGIKWRQGCGFPPIEVTTHEEIRGVSTKLKDLFIDFPDLAAAFEYHGRLLTNPHGPYAGCRRLLDGSRFAWRAYVPCIAAIYATSHTYADTLMSVIERYHLYDWNLGENA